MVAPSSRTHDPDATTAGLLEITAGADAALANCPAASFAAIMNAGVDVPVVNAPAFVTSPVASRLESAAPVVSPPARPILKLEVATDSERTAP